jgi:hypothetical protein
VKNVKEAPASPLLRATNEGLPRSSRAERLSVVIPALDEAHGIADICARVLSTRDALREAGVDDLELVVVDDGSSDRTAEIAEEMDGVRVIRHPGNRGYGAAIKTGFRACTGDLLAFLDADGTYPPESYPKMAKALLEQGADVVVGSRMADPESGMPLTRRLGNRFFVTLVNMLGAGRITDSASGQRIVRREVLARLYPLPDGLNFTPVMTTRALHENVDMIEVPIRYHERVGDSKLSVIHDGRRFLTTILWTAMAYNPARVLGLAGLGALALAGLIGLGLVVMRLSGVTTLGPWGVGMAFATLVLGVTGVSVINLGITFNYLVSLFHAEPLRQGLLGDRPLFPGLDRAFGWLGLGAMIGGLAVGAGSIVAGMNGWDITRTWLWLLGGAMLLLVGMQLAISWVLMRVLEELSEREAHASRDLHGDTPAQGVADIGRASAETGTAPAAPLGAATTTRSR